MIYEQPDPMTRRLAVLAACLAAGGAAAVSGRPSTPAMESPPAVAALLPRQTVRAPVRQVSTAPAERPADPAEAEMDPARLGLAVDAVEAEVARGAFPGAALAAGREGSVALLRGLGETGWDGAAVDPAGTVYDVASLTKVVATTTAAMLLVEEGKLELDAPVSRYVPDFSGGAKDRVTIRHLLTHTSGLPAGAPYSAPTPEKSLARLVKTPLEAAPGKRTEYSDVGFVVLWAAAEQAAGEPLPALLQRRVYGPLGMASTGFAPGEGCERCAPTWRRADGTPVRGVVHDPTARALAGVAGNAGLFSTARDLARFAGMLAGGGELDGVRVLEKETIRTFARRQPGARNRALGWEAPKANGTGPAGREMSPESFGHTGFTGTSLWVDPERGTWAVLLSNRTFRSGPNRMQALRRTVHDAVSEAADYGAFGG